MDTAPQKAAVSQRAWSLARRLLSGEGSATLHAYRLGETMDAIAHGSHDGQLLVSGQLAPGQALYSVESIEVRLDLTVQAVRPDYAITAASAHLLGHLRWLSSAEGMERAPQLSEALAAPLVAPHGRLGVIETVGLMLHDFTGATAIELTTPLPAPEPFVSRWDAYEVAAVLSPDQLRDICWAVLTKTIPGEAEQQAVPHLCAHSVGQTIILDVDRLGITVLHIGRQELTVVFAAFASPAETLTDLRWSIARLALDAAPTRSTHR